MINKKLSALIILLLSIATPQTTQALWPFGEKRTDCILCGKLIALHKLASQPYARSNIPDGSAIFDQLNETMNEHHCTRSSKELEMAIHHAQEQKAQALISAPLNGTSSETIAQSLRAAAIVSELWANTANELQTELEEKRKKEQACCTIEAEKTTPAHPASTQASSSLAADPKITPVQSS